MLVWWAPTQKSSTTAAHSFSSSQARECHEVLNLDFSSVLKNKALINTSKLFAVLFYVIPNWAFFFSFKLSSNCVCLSYQVLLSICVMLKHHNYHVWQLESQIHVELFRFLSFTDKNDGLNVTKTLKRCFDFHIQLNTSISWCKLVYFVFCR